MTINQYIAQEEISLSQLADRVGVSRAAMSRYAKGQRIPKPPIMSKISVATGGLVTPADFYDCIEEAECQLHFSKENEMNRDSQIALTTALFFLFIMFVIVSALGSGLYLFLRLIGIY